MTALVEAAAAGFRYAGKDTAIGPFSLQVDRGEVHLLRGPSGCGKTTLARLLSGAIPHLYRGEVSGSVRIDGRDSRQVPLWMLSREVGFVAQNPAAQMLGATVADDIAFGLETLGLPGAEVDARRDEVLGRFGLEALASRDPRTLSGGEQQLLLLAGMASRRPNVLVLDEPCAMLDAAGRALVIKAFEDIQRDGLALVVSEHRPWMARRRPDRIHDLPAAAVRTTDLPTWRRAAEPFRVSLRGLRVRLGKCSVLDGLDLQLDSGRVVAITGRNGAGKTTLLRTLAGLQGYNGEVSVDGARSLRWGMCFQNPDRQFFNPSARAELEFGGGAEASGTADRLLDLLGLRAVAHQAPLLLSEGEKKRLALGVMLAAPALGAVCLDEPTVGQDDEHRRQVGRVVRHLAAHGMLCVVATHDLEWASEWADDVVLLSEGRVTAWAVAADLQTGPRPWRHAGLIAPAAFDGGQERPVVTIGGRDRTEGSACVDSIRAA